MYIIYNSMLCQLAVTITHTHQHRRDDELIVCSSVQFRALLCSHCDWLSSSSPLPHLLPFWPHSHIDEGGCQELTAPLCAGQISLLVDGLFISSTLMFEGLAWPKKKKSIPSSAASATQVYLATVSCCCVCARACFYVHADRFFCLPDSPCGELK